MLQNRTSGSKLSPLKFLCKSNQQPWNGKLICPKSEMSHCTTKQTKWCAPSKDSDQPGHPPSLISLRCQHEEGLGPLLPIKHTVKTLIGLGECPGRSESSLGPQVIFWFCHVVAQMSIGHWGVQLRSLSIWTASSESGTYRLCEQRRFRRACASAQSRQNLRCSLIQAVSQEEPSDRKPDPWPLWMAGHAQLKFVMTECSKTQIRLTGLSLTICSSKLQSPKGNVSCLFSLGPRWSPRSWFRWPSPTSWSFLTGGYIVTGWGSWNKDVTTIVSYFLQNWINDSKLSREVKSLVLWSCRLKNSKWNNLTQEHYL